MSKERSIKIIHLLSYYHLTRKRLKMTHRLNSNRISQFNGQPTPAPNASKDMPKNSSPKSLCPSKEEWQFIACIRSDRFCTPKSKLVSSINISDITIKYKYEIYLFKIDVKDQKGYYVRIVITPENPDLNIIFDDVFYLDQDKQKMLLYMKFIQLLFPECEREVLMNQDKLSIEATNEFIKTWKSQTQNS